MSTPASQPQEAAALASSMRKPRIYTIPPSQPFLETLAKALLDGNLPTPGGKPRGPLELSGITLLLPTPRASRALQDAFLATASFRSILLPRIRPISEGDDDLNLLTQLSSLRSMSSTAELELPPAVTKLERQLVLTKLVMQWSAAMRAADQSDDDPPDGQPHVAAGADTPAQAANLARELARLVDMVETENVSLAGLEGIVDDEFSAHWQQTLTFLKIVTQWWPAHLAEFGKLSPMDRRNQLILAEARRLNETRPAGPMIVAGVTGSIPATVELMRAVASLDQGAIVLPGVDLDLDEASWQAITSGGDDKRPHSEHPQFGLKTLLDRLGVNRKDVMLLSSAKPAPGLTVRGKLVSEAMRPSSTTAGWHTFAASAHKPSYVEAVDGLTLIETPSAQDEAETVALIMREVAQTPGKTAALVSPDRLLARRVAIRLEAWGIRVDDSAGRPFAKTVPGTVLDLTIEAIATRFAPGPTIALLKHPLVRLQLPPFEIRRAARAIELAAFRGPYIGQGIGGIRAALDSAERDCHDGDEAKSQRRPRAVRRLFPQDWQGAHDLLNRLEAAVAPLIALFEQSDRLPLATFAQAHTTVAENLCAEPAPGPA
ncbi:MAG: double-strand break repair protein AddB, partial [Hyphomicrobiaceae bacterium]